MGTDQPRHRARPPRALNRLVIDLLGSPLHGLLDDGLCVLRFHGRSTGRPIALPVFFAAGGDHIVVLVGDASDKQWWRNFTTPAPIEVHRGGQVTRGSARILATDDPAYPMACRTYRDRHHIDQQPTDRVLLIDVNR
jgi:hypothetical protein